MDGSTCQPFLSSGKVDGHLFTDIFSTGQLEPDKLKPSFLASLVILLKYCGERRQKF
jgi:hypothetical protein